MTAVPPDYARVTIPFSQTLSEAGYEAWFAGRPRHSARGARRRPLLPSHSGPRTPLDYQRESMAALEELGQSQHAGLLALPTGGGKTFTALSFALDWLERNGGDLLWLAPMADLVFQAMWECRRLWWARPRGYHADLRERAPSKCYDDRRQFVFSTLQSALTKSGDALASHASWGIVVVDECHYLTRNRFGDVSRKLGALSPLLLGLSATPGRRDCTEFEEFRAIFEENIVAPRSLGESPVQKLRERGVYADVNVVRLEPTTVGDNDRYIVRNPAGSRSQTLAALSAGRLDAVVSAVRDELAGKSVLVFCRDLQHSEVVAAALHQNGIDVAVVGSSYSDEHNRVEVEAFRSGERRVLVNAKLVAVGTDLPGADAAILTVPFTSPILFEQILGRISRGEAVGGTARATLLEFDDHYRRFGGPQGYGRYLSEWGNVLR